jgi:CO/xanthine dehydrogenase Mo-binding subunit/aerobic-type carbon monoxide dehydrogenase small subunit (CoxS/CutS family)
MSSLNFDGEHLEVQPEEYASPLVETLRGRGKSSVKMPCGEGTCGGCTVLLDGMPVVSCCLPTARAIGKQVQSAASLTATTPSGSALATELAVRGALQCGFCIPGLVASATAALQAGDVTNDVRSRLVGHLCRCTGYAGLVDAVTRTAKGERSGLPPRTDGLEKAQGVLRFTADFAPPGTLTGRLLTCRSPHAFVSIEPGTAMRVAGAVRVLGPQDAPDLLFDTNPHVDHPVLAPRENRVFAREGRYIGDIVGLVIAETPAAAREMARRIVQIEEPLPVVFDVAAAQEPDAPRVRLADASNVAFEMPVGAPEAEVDAALAGADRVFTHHFEVGSGPVAAMERPAALARWDDGVCDIWSTSQTPQVIPARLGQLLGLAPECFSMQAVPLGGGFGLKEEMFLEPAAAVASRACGGRPVLIETTRAQLGALRRRHAAYITTTTGCAADGTMLARKVDVTLDAGGEVSHSALVLENLLLIAATLYPVAPTRAYGRAVLTNNASSGAFRGYGAAEIGFGVESHLDELARFYGIDPLEYRRRHVLRAGQLDALNEWPVDSFASMQCLDALAEASQSPLPAADPSGRWRYGRGGSLFSIVSAASSVAHKDSSVGRCRVDEDGRIVVETVVPDMGQGIHSTFAQVTAERVGVSLSRVRVHQQRSADAPTDEGAFASRGVYVSANSLVAAADRLLADIADRLGVAPKALIVDDRCIRAGSGELAWTDLAGLMAEVTVASTDNGLVIGGQLAEVAVDTWTGRVIVDRVVSVHDVGRVLNPELARGQVVGGVVQGIGVSLNERSRFVNGAPLDANLFDQAIPTMLVEPRIEDVFVGDGNAKGLLGAKGLGEAPMVGVPAAIGNAIRDAIGIRLTSLPFTPEVVYEAIGSGASIYDLTIRPPHNTAGRA